VGEGEEAKLAFEYLPADPSKKAKPKEDDEDEDGEEPQAALVDVAPPRKALPGPRERKPRSTGTVPPVPRPKDE
jgi:ATP-dependent Clp protease ATP-binding subunit ClpA